MTEDEKVKNDENEQTVGEEMPKSEKKGDTPPLSSDTQKAKTPLSQNKTFSFKAKVLIALVIIIGLAFLAFYIPDRRSVVADELSKILLNDREIPKDRIKMDKNTEALALLVANCDEKKLMKSFTPQGAISRIIYNYRYFSKRFFDSSKKGQDGPNPAFKDFLQVNYSLKTAIPSLKHQGRTIKKIHIKVRADDFCRFEVVELKPVEFFDNEDSVKLISLFIKVYDDAKTPFPEKYNKLFDIASLANRYYNKLVLKSEKMENEHLSAYKTFSSYLRFKREGKGNFKDANLTELIRCYLYDTKPPTKNASVNISEMLHKINQVDLSEIDSKITYQLEMLIKKYGTVLETQDQKGFVLLLLAHPQEHGRKRIKSYMLNADPGTIVEFLDSITMGYFSELSSEKSEKVIKTFLEMLYEVFKETPYISVKRQSLVTMDRLRNENPSIVETAIREAKASNIPRLLSTVDYITKSSE